MNLFAFLNIVNVPIAVFLGTITYSQNQSNKLNRIFFVLMLITAYTAFCEYFRLTSVDLETALIWHKASMLWPFFSAIILWFVINFSGSKILEVRYIKIILFLPSILILLFHLFSDLLYKNITHQYYGWGFTPATGLLPTLVIIYFLFYNVTSIILLIKYYMNEKSSNQRRNILLTIIGISLPALTGFVFNGLLPQTGYRLPPLDSISFLIGAAFLFKSLSGNTFFRVNKLSMIGKVFSTIEDMLLVVDQKGKIVIASKSFLHCVGYIEAEVLGKNLFQFISPDSKLNDLFTSNVMGQELESRLITSDNSEIPVSIVPSITHGQTDNDKLFLLIIRDSRERKRSEQEMLSLQKRLEEMVNERTQKLEESNFALRSEINIRINVENALRESESKYKGIFDFAPIGIFVSDTEGKIVISNLTFARLLGYNFVEEVKQINTNDIYYDEAELSLFQNKYKDYYGNFNHEFRWKKKNGSMLWVHLTAHTIRNIDNTKEYLEAFVADITSKKEIEDELTKSERRYRDLFENSLIGIYRTTPSGRIIIANAALIRILGFESFEELKNRNLEKEGFEKDSNEREKFQRIVESNGYISDQITTWIKKDGNVITVRENAKCIYDVFGKPIYYEGTVEDITEKVKIGEALKESEARYRNLVENINEIFYIADKNGKIVYISQNAILYLGYPAEFFIGKSAFFPVHKDDFRRVYNFYQERLQSGSSDARIEFRIVKQDGSFYWVEQITRIVRDLDWNVIEYRNVLRDITERKIAEEKVQLLVQAIKSVSEAVSITDLNNNLLYVNDAFTKIYGYSEAELLGKSISIVHSSKNPSSILEEIRVGAIHGGWTGELINIKKDGTEFPIFLSTGNVINEKAEAFALVGVARDITERRNAENQLDEYRMHLEKLVVERTSELDNVNQLLKKEIDKLKIADEIIQNQVSFLQTLIDTIPNPVYIRDKDKLFYGCNKAYENFVGCSHDELVGKSIFNIPLIHDTHFVDEKDNELLKNRGEQTYELKVKDASGKEYDMLFYKATFNNRDGSVGGIVGIMLDVTNLKTMEREIRDALKKEKELSQLKSRFISVASHEFRTPLTSILASADLLEMYGRNWPDSKYFQYIGHIQKSVEDMTELINDVLTINREDQGRTRFSPEKINFRELIKNILGNLKLSAPSTISFLFNYYPKENVFYFDRKMITQIVTNLISNSIKYSPNGGKISINVTEESKLLTFSVADNGIGIDEADIPHLYEPFQRGKNVGNIAGTGLGLSIMKRAVEYHDGSVAILSKLNGGTVIKVMFPLDKVRKNNLS